jgi:hypothetical protein
MPKKPAKSRSDSDEAVQVTTRHQASPAAAEPRREAIAASEMVNVFHADVSKPEGDGNGKSKGRSSSSSKQRIFVQAWVRNVAFSKNVWIDTRFLDRAGKLIHSETVPLGYVEPAGGGGDLFLVDSPVPKAGRRQLTREPRRLDFRLYYQVNDDVFTDGVLHQFEV